MIFVYLYVIQIGSMYKCICIYGCVVVHVCIFMYVDVCVFVYVFIIYMYKKNVCVNKNT
jgi:hypothetical protein